MSMFPTYAAPGYQFEAMPDLSRLETRERLSQSAVDGFFVIVDNYKALHILLPDEPADNWMTRPNDNFLFAGQTPLEFVVRAGIPGMQQVRSLLDAARGGR